jgi:hypothetical protein
MIVCGFVACNASVDKENDGDDSKLDSVVNKIDTTLDKGWDTAKQNFKDLKGKVKDKLDRDSAK